jgi:hypothetical protein
MATLTTTNNVRSVLFMGMVLVASLVGPIRTDGLTPSSYPSKGKGLSESALNLLSYHEQLTTSTTTHNQAENWGLVVF